MNPLKFNLDIMEDSYETCDLMQGYDYNMSFIMTDNYTNLDLTGVTIQVQMQKADHKFIIQTEKITVVGNVINVEIDKDLTREFGKGKLQIVLVKNSKTFGSWVIKCNIKASAINDNDGQSENKVTITETLVNKITEANNTKVELDKSIANGDTSKMRVDIDKNSVDIKNNSAQLAEIVNILPNGTNDTNNIKRLIAEGHDVLMGNGTFYVDSGFNLPNDRTIRIKGQGLDKTYIKAIGNIDILFFKDFGKINGNKIGEFTVDGDMKINTVLRIVESKQCKINRIRCTGIRKTPFVFGCEEETGATKFYEAVVQDIQIQMGYYGSPNTFVRPDYGIELLADTTDSVYNNIVINNVKLAGIKTHPYSVCNTFNQVHVYGFPEVVEQDYRVEYGLDVNGDCIIGQYYSDCVKKAGVKIRGGNVNISNSRFLWNRADANSYAFEIDNGVGTISIINNSYVGMKCPKPVNWLGEIGRHVTIFGNTSEFDRNLIGNDTEFRQTLSTWDAIKIYLTSLPNKFADFIIGDTNKPFWKIRKDKSNEGNLHINRFDDEGKEETVINISRWSGLTKLLNIMFLSGRINSPNGTNTTLDFEKSDKRKWRLFATNDIESGSSKGSNFQIGRYDNNNAWIDAPLNIERETGNINMLSGNIKIQGTWQNPFIMNNFYIWVDSNMKMKIKSTPPANENDGTVIGSQT